MKPDLKSFNPKTAKVIVEAILIMAGLGGLLFNVILDTSFGEWLKDFFLIGMILWLLCHKKIENIINKKYKIINNEA